MSSIADPSSEGDVNLSPLRREWEAHHVHEATRALLDADAKHFLHQSLSTPCLNALVACEGNLQTLHADRRRGRDLDLRPGDD